MKLRSILLAILMPLTSFAATNAFDNVKINTSLKYTGGTPGAGKILESDANGNAAWSNAQPFSLFVTNINGSANIDSVRSGQNFTLNISNTSPIIALTVTGAVYTAGTTPTVSGRVINIGTNNFGAAASSGGGGDVFKASNNVFSVSNTFLAGMTVGGTNSFYRSITNTFGTNGSSLVISPASGANALYLTQEANAGNTSAYAFYIDAGNTWIQAPSGHIRLTTAGAESRFNTGSVTLGTNTFINGSLEVTNNVTLGKSSANTLLLNGQTLSIPNGLNIGSGIFTLPALTTGDSTNGANVVFNRNTTFISNSIYAVTAFTPGTGALTTNTIDFLDGPIKTLSITNNTFFQGTNHLAFGKSSTVNVWITGGSANFTLTFNSNWIPIAPFSTIIVTNKTALLSVTSITNTEAGVRYSLTQQP